MEAVGAVRVILARCRKRVVGVGGGVAGREPIRVGSAV
eukprot:COSAG02_NODE_27712_length_604_cov_0.784158_1_plen_37_part_01